MNSSFKPPKDQSLITRILFLSSFTLFMRSLLFSITRSDFSHLRPEMQLETIKDRYNRTKSSQHRFRLLEMFKPKIIVAGGCAILSGIITAYLSTIIKRLITYISSTTTNHQGAYYDLVLWSVLLIFKILLVENSFRMFSEIGIQAQMITQTKILAKVADIPLHQKHKILKSEVLSVFIIEVKRIHSFCKMAHLVFLSPTSFTLAMGLILWERWSMGFVVIHAVVLVLMILYFINAEMNVAKSKKLKYQRQRIGTNIELISQLKQLKNLGWEDMLHVRTKSFNEEENKLNAEIAYLNEIYELILILIPIVVFSLMFLFDYISGEVGQIQYMNVSQIYILINFINLIHAPMRSVKVIIAGLYDFRTALNKIEAFFQIEASELLDKTDPSLPVGTVKINNLVNLGMSGNENKLSRQNSVQPQSLTHIEIQQDYNEQMSTEKKIQMKESGPHVQGLEINFNILIKPGEKLIILDSANQGSTLLASLAGLIDKYSGTLAYNGKLGYVSSKCWFAPTSIKENIIFGQQYSKRLLEESIYNADLSEELKLYNHREWTQMNEDTFSVSQLNRVSYARALYSKPDILLLDDTFRTMNRATVEALNHRRQQKLSNKTFIIATDSVYCIGEKDHILIFDNGKAVEYGKYIELLKDNNSNIHKFLGSGDQTNTEKNLLEQKIIKDRQKQAQIVHTLRSRFKKKLWIKNLLKEIRTHGVGHVHKMMDNYHITKRYDTVKRPQDAKKPPSVNSTFFFYKKLFSYSPPGLILLTYFLITISEITMLVLSWFLGYMARPSQQAHEIRNTVIFFTFTFIYIFTYFVQSYLDTKSVQQSCNNISSHMFSSISRASPTHFQNIPLTITTDKLNQDYYKIFLIFSKFSHAYRNTILLLGTLVLITIESPTFLWYGTPLAVFNAFFFLYLHRYQNQIAIQHSSFSAAILSSVEQIFDGIETHRFYGNPRKFISQQQIHFYNYGVYRNEERQGYHLISFMSQLSSMLLVWYIAYHAINTKSILSAASVVYLGASISYSIKVSHILSNINREIVQAEVGIIKNMKKMFDYIELEPEGNYELPGKPKDWPRIPEVKIERLSVRRTRDSVHRSLKEITLQVKPRERVSIFGRGTSGVYSVFPSIMKEMTPIANLDGVLGTITINDVNIAHIGKKYLVEQFFHITPTPFIFTSTLIDNIDPFSEFPKHQVIKLLSKLNIQHFIPAKQKDLLDYPIILQQTPQALKHLINICRAILHSPSLLLCESIQTLNGIQIQSLLSRQLNYSTLLFINPHLSFIKESDRIIFLSHGKIIENDTPANIFQNENSKFAHQLQNSEPLQFMELKKTVSSISSLGKIELEGRSSM